MFHACVEVREGVLLELARQVRKAGFGSTADNLETAWREEDNAASRE
jgi:hypothetical protein